MLTKSIVAPQKFQRLETLALCCLALLVCAAAAVYALTRAGTSQASLLDWQLSSFFDLGPDDQAIHSALIVTAEDIGWMNYDAGDWPQPAELDKLLMPPFQKDEFWKLHGGVEWRIIREASVVNGGDTGYLGVGGSAPGQSAYLLVFRHRHVGATYTNQIDVWVNKNPDPPEPGGTKAETLVKSGWRQVIPYSGADERARMQGK